MIDTSSDQEMGTAAEGSKREAGGREIDKEIKTTAADPNPTDDREIETAIVALDYTTNHRDTAERTTRKRVAKNAQEIAATIDGIAGDRPRGERRPHLAPVNSGKPH